MNHQLAEEQKAGHRTVELRLDNRDNCWSPEADSHTSTSSSLGTPVASIAPSPPPPSSGEEKGSSESLLTAKVTVNRTPLCSIVARLPDGIITAVEYPERDESRSPSDEAEDVDDKTEVNLLACLRPGRSLLPHIQGRGVQTLMLNAYCGNARRRMYARLRGSSTDLPAIACELLCDFNTDGANSAVRIARIQVCPIGSELRPCFTLKPPNTNNIMENAFTTRHNASCALIYLDPSSIPLLGHFPSEATGQSIFTLLHPDDVLHLKRAHEELHRTCGSKLVSTTPLRLIGHDRQVICVVSSEWSAYVNPWSGQIEMVVGRHTPLFLSASSQLIALREEHVLRAQDASVHRLLTKVVNLGGKDTLEETGVDVNAVVQTRLLVAEKNSGSIRSGKPAKSDVQLSYEQINCLENVHRLLRSQASTGDTAPDDGSTCFAAWQCANNHSAGSNTELTRKLLQIHDRRCEQNCRTHWSRRLSSSTSSPLSNNNKRPTAESAPILQPPAAKVLRTTRKRQHNNDTSVSSGGTADQASLLAKLQQQSTIALWNNYMNALQSLIAKNTAEADGEGAVQR